MKKCSTLKLLLVAISLFLSVSLQAQEMSPVTVRVETAGTLSTLIQAKDKYLVTDLTLSGNLNGTDILYIREMAGGGLWKDSKTDGKLKKLDMANANIVYGGDAYYKYYYDYDEYDRDSIDNYGLVTSETSYSPNRISEYMFYNLSNLNSIILPQNITYIEDAAFADCTGLTSLKIPDKVTEISENAFAGCIGLKTIVIPNTVTYFGSCAFRDCAGLSSIAIPLGLKTLWTNAFYGCTGLKEFIVSENDMKFAAVEGVLFNKDKSEILAYPNAKSSVYIIPNSVGSISEEAFESCSNLTSVTIPNSVKKICSDAFALCTGLTSITIPASVTDIDGENPFYGCDGLKEILAPEDNPKYKTIDGVLYNKDVTQIIAYPNAKSTEYTVLNGVETINPFSFTCCSTLTSVTIPNSVQNIDYYAFCYSPKLTSVNMGNAIISIGGAAFWKCTGLKLINIPNSVKTIDMQAFADCTALTSVSIGKSVTSIGDYAFLGCSALKEIHCKNSVPSELLVYKDSGSKHTYSFGLVDKTICKLYVPKGSYSAYKSAEGWKEFNIILEEESTAISEVETNNISVYTESGNVVIKNAEPGKIVSVYNTLGSLLQTVKVADNELIITLPINQIYFIRIADKRYKVAL